MPSATKAPTLASRIEEAMGLRCLTEAEIAAATGIDTSHVNSYLHTIERLYKAAAYELRDGVRVWCLTPTLDTRKRRTAEAVPQGEGYRTGACKRKRPRAMFAEANAIAERLRAARKEQS